MAVGKRKCIPFSMRTPRTARGAFKLIFMQFQYSQFSSRLSMGNESEFFFRNAETASGCLIFTFIKSTGIYFQVNKKKLRDILLI